MNYDQVYLKKLHTILAWIQACGLNVPPIIAGGAIRDMLLDKEIADIDVFYNGDLDEKGLKTFFPKTEVCEYGVYEDSSFNVKYKCWSNMVPVPIQLIEVKENVLEHINKFPTKLSRVFYTRLQGVQNVTKTFEIDAIAKIVTFDKPVNHQYLNKMRDKFPSPEWLIHFTDPAFNPEQPVEVF